MKFDEILAHINNIMATMPVEEKQILYDEALKVPDDGIIVDIGTCDGASAFIMALANPMVQVWTIDPNVGPHFLEKRRELDLVERIHFINETSNNASYEWFDNIDLLFIDGVHSKQGILDDINNWAKWVKKDSTVLLHDYLWYGDNVKDAIKESSVKLKLIDVPFGLYDGKPVGIARTKRI